MEIIYNNPEIVRVSADEGWVLFPHGVLRKFQPNGTTRFKSNVAATEFVYKRAEESQLHKDIALWLPWTGEDVSLLGARFGLRLDVSDATLRFTHKSLHDYPLAGKSTAVAAEERIQLLKEAAAREDVLAMKALRLMAKLKLSGSI